MNSSSCEQSRPTVEVNDYHLIFDLHGILVAIGEGQTKSRPIVLKLGLKEFLYTCVKKFTVHMVINNEEELFEALKHNHRENMRFLFIF
jgi:hypothetical protein